MDSPVFITIDETIELLQAIGADNGAVCTKLNELYARVYNMAIEKTLITMPHFVMHLIERMANMDKMRRDFLVANKDLLTDDTFLPCLLEVEQANPGMQYDKILSIAAGRVRTAKKNGTISNAMLSKPVQPITPEKADTMINGVL